MKFIPFEVIHPEEARYMQWLFSLGYRLTGPASYFVVKQTPPPSKRKRASNILQRYERSRLQWKQRKP